MQIRKQLTEVLPKHDRVKPCSIVDKIPVYLENLGGESSLSAGDSAVAVPMDIDNQVYCSRPRPDVRIAASLKIALGSRCCQYSL
jgi:hypothetical protein